MFKFCPNEYDTVRDEIQRFIVANGLQGSMVHMLDVYDKLKEDGHDQTTCSAGGLYSIFDNRDLYEKELHPIIGKESTDLIKLFGSVKLIPSGNLDCAHPSISPEHINNIEAIRKAITFNQKIQHDFKHMVIK